MELRLGARRRAGQSYLGFTLDNKHWKEVRNVWMRDWIAETMQQRNRFAVCGYDEWLPTDQAETCPFKQSSRRKFLRLPQSQQDAARLWVMDNLLNKSKPIFLIGGSGDLHCVDMEHSEPSWTNCSFRYAFDGSPRTISLAVNGIRMVFAIPKSAELAIRECFRHPSVSKTWCDTVCLNIVYIVTGDRNLTKPMYSAMGETYLRAQTCILDTVLMDELYYTRAWTVQEWLLSKPLQGDKQCYCQLLQPLRRPQLVNFSKTSSAGQVILVISKMIQKVKESNITDPDDRPLAALALIRALGFIDKIPLTIGGATHHELFSRCTIAVAQVMMDSVKPDHHFIRKHSNACPKAARVCAMLLSCMSQPDLLISQCGCSTIDGTLVGPALNEALDDMTLSTFGNPNPHKEPLLKWVTSRMKARHGLQGVLELVVSLVLDLFYLPFAVLGLLLQALPAVFFRGESELRASALQLPARMVVSLGVLVGSAIVQLDVRASFLRRTEWSHPIRMRNPLLSLLGVLMVFAPDLLSGEPNGRAGVATRALTAAFYCLAWTDETAEGLTTTTIAGLVLYQTEHVPSLALNVRWYFVTTAAFAVVLAVSVGKDGYRSPQLGKVHTLGQAMAFAWMLVCVLTVTMGVYDHSTQCSERLASDAACPQPLQLMLSWVLPVAIMALWWLKTRAMHDSWSLRTKGVAWVFSLGATLVLLFSGHPRRELCDRTDDEWCTMAVVHPQRMEVCVYSALGAIALCILCVVTPFRKRVQRWVTRLAPSSSSSGKRVTTAPARTNSVALGRNALELVKPEDGCCTHLDKAEMMALLHASAPNIRFGDDDEMVSSAEQTVRAVRAHLEGRHLTYAEGFEAVDVDGDGFVSALDLRKGFAALGLLVSDDATNAFFEQMCEGAAAPRKRRTVSVRALKLHIHLPADRAAWEKMLTTGHEPPAVTPVERKASAVQTHGEIVEESREDDPAGARVGGEPSQEEATLQNREAGSTAPVGPEQRMGTGEAPLPGQQWSPAKPDAVVEQSSGGAGEDGVEREPVPQGASLGVAEENAEAEGVTLAPAPAVAPLPPRRASTEANLLPPPMQAAQHRPRGASLAMLKPLEPTQEESLQPTPRDAAGPKPRRHKATYAKPTLGRLKPLPSAPK